MNFMNSVNIPCLGQVGMSDICFSVLGFSMLLIPECNQL